MAAIAFDTHAAATRYKRAGFSDDQVEALVDIARETTALPDVSTLATKGDLQQLEATLEAKVATAQTQAITIILSGTAMIVTLATVLSRLIH